MDFVISITSLSLVSTYMFKDYFASDCKKTQINQSGITKHSNKIHWSTSAENSGHELTQTFGDEIILTLKTEL